MEKNNIKYIYYISVKVKNYFEKNKMSLKVFEIDMQYCRLIFD